MKIKKIAISVVCSLILSVTLVLSGCSFGNDNRIKTIVSIEKTMTNGLKDTYTITYSDNTTYNFEIENGKDGADADVEAIYRAYAARYPDATFEDFLNAVVKVGVDQSLTVSNKALLSSFKVYTEFTETTYSGWPYQRVINQTAVYCGSAVVYSVNENYTYFITNYHVLYDGKSSDKSKLAKKITCYAYGSESAPQKTNETSSDGCIIYEYGDYAIFCEYVGGSVTCDLAIIKAKTSDVKKINPNVKAVTFAESYHVGESAIAIGNSENEGISVTKGIVSVDNEYINYSIDGTQRSYRSMRIDTAIYGGNSGGGLFDGDGNLIGITNAGNGEDQNINYAIPVNIVKPVTENILHYLDGTVKTLKLGVTVSAKNSRYVYDEALGYGDIYEDVFVSDVISDSLISSLGLKAGDRLVSFNVNKTEYKLKRYFNLGDYLYTVRPGDTVSFTYERAGVTVNSAELTVSSANFITVS